MLSLVARIQAQPGQEKELEAELRRLVPPTLAETGCVNYDLHRSLDRPGYFLFYENWETRAHWEAHDRSPHIEAFRGRAGQLVVDVQLDFLERVDASEPSVS